MSYLPGAIPTPDATASCASADRGGCATARLHPTRSRTPLRVAQAAGVSMILFFSTKLLRLDEVATLREKMRCLFPPPPPRRSHLKASRRPMRDQIEQNHRRPLVNQERRSCSISFDARTNVSSTRNPRSDLRMARDRPFRSYRIAAPPRLWSARPGTS